jgi:hypothetical protein
MRDMAQGEGPLETHLWTWSGRYFGSRNDDALWTHSGHLPGRFYFDDIYGAAGGYIGELRDADRLITNLAKKGRARGLSVFDGAARASCVDHMWTVESSKVMKTFRHPMNSPEGVGFRGLSDLPVNPSAVSLDCQARSKRIADITGLRGNDSERWLLHAGYGGRHTPSLRHLATDNRIF